MRVRLGAIVAMASGVALWPAGAAAQGEAPAPTVERVLVLSLPTLAPAELDEGAHPNLVGLLDRSAVATLSTRGVGRVTSPGDGYATLGAGARAEGLRDVDGLAFPVDEVYLGEPAGTVFRRRTGLDPGDGIVSLGYPAVARHNDGLRFDAELGALGDALDDAGIDRAVIANADLGAEEEEQRYGRQAAMALVASGGRVDEGAVGTELLTEEAEAPYGLRLDLDAVEDAFRDVWQEDSVVLVEASDLVRSDAYRELASSRQETDQRSAALAATDELVGRLLASVDAERDAVVVVGPYHQADLVHLTLAALAAPGVEPGLLRSASTRRSGYVTIVDVAPTVLDLLGVEQPTAMEGSPFERGGRGGSATERRELLADIDAAAQFRDKRVSPATVVFIVLQVLLWAVALVAIATRRRKLSGAVAVAALAVLGFLPATYLTRLFPFERWGSGAYWLFVLGVGTLIGVLALAVARAHPLDPLLVVLSAVAGLLVLDVLLGAPLQVNSVYGYSPTVAGRFSGLGNLAFAQLAAAAIILAGLLAQRIGGRRGALTGIAILVVALVVDGAPWWGSDVGGVLTLVAAAGLTSLLLLGLRVRFRAVLLLAAAAVAAVLLAGAVDMSRPPEDRTHLGRLIERIGDEGWGAFQTVVLRKLEANLSVLTSSVWTLMVPVVFAFVAYALWRAPGYLRLVREQPELRASLAGFAVAAALGFALNDSGIAVPGVMLGVVNASIVYLVITTEAPPEAALGSDGVLDGKGRRATAIAQNEEVST